MEKTTTMFLHWNTTTKTCYKHNMVCEGCPNKTMCEMQPWNENPLKIKNVKYATMRTLMNIGEPDKLKICDCKNHLEFDYVIDKTMPNGDVVSTAIFKCTVCGKEFTEDEVCLL